MFWLSRACEGAIIARVYKQSSSPSIQTFFCRFLGNVSWGKHFANENLIFSLEVVCVCFHLVSSGFYHFAGSLRS